MKNKKIVFILIILVLYLLIMLLVFHNKKDDDNTSNKEIVDNTYKYLVIDNISNLSYKNNKWKKIAYNSIDNSNNTFKVYENNNYLGEYKLKYGQKWNLFDENDSFVSYDGSIFAYSTNFDIKLIRFVDKKITDEDKNNISKDYNIKNYDYLMNNQVINVDIDGNNEMDQIIALSNIDDDYSSNSNFYNLISVKLNNKLYRIIDENKSNTNDLNVYIYSINRIFRFDNDFYIVIERIEGAETDFPSSNIMIYRFDNEKFVNVIND